MPDNDDASPANPRSGVLRALAIVGLLVCLTILGFLGTWQGSKFLKKRVTFALMDERMAMEVADVSSAGALDETMDFRRVRLRRGAWSVDESFVVPKRFHENLPGLWVVTPWVFDDGSAVLVHRGWVPEEKGVEAAKKAPLPGADLSVVGLVHTPDERVADKLAREDREGGDLDASGWFELGELDAELAYDVLPYDAPPRTETVIVLGDDFSRGWDDLPEPTHDHITKPYLTPAVHFGYATLWYGSALLLIWLFWAGWTGRLDPEAR